MALRLRHNEINCAWINMQNISVNIRRLRQKQGLSLRELAHLTGITPSMISQIENGKTSPSLATLKNICDKLETTIGKLIDDKPSTTDQVLRLPERKTMHQKEQGIYIELLTTPDPYKQMEPLYFTLEPNASSGSEYRHYGQEFLVVLKGKLEIILNTNHYILNKGDSFYFNSSTPHKYRNLSKGNTELVWIVTPPSF